MQQQENEQQSLGYRGFLNIIVFASQSLAVSVEVILHRRFGSKYIGFQGLAAMLMIFFFNLFWPEEDPTPLLAFLGVYLMFCLFARTSILRRGMHGTTCHSRYTGEPHLLRVFPFLNEFTVKRIVEPMLVFLGGCLLLPVSLPLGSYLMLAAAGLLVSVNLNLHYVDVRAQEMRDAFIEQRNIAERFREMNGDHF